MLLYVVHGNDTACWINPPKNESRAQQMTDLLDDIYVSYPSKPESYPAVGPGGEELDNVVLARGRGVVEGRATVDIESQDVLGQGVQEREQRGAAARGGEVQERLEAVVPERFSPRITTIEV